MPSITDRAEIDIVLWECFVLCDFSCKFVATVVAGVGFFVVVEVFVVVVVGVVVEDVVVVVEVVVVVVLADSVVVGVVVVVGSFC